MTNPSTRALPPWPEALTSPDAAAPAAASAPRADWVDAARAIAITGVVFGHALSGLMTAGLIDRAGPLGAVYPHLQTYQMPAFFLVAGLFVQQRIGGRGSSFLRSITTRIAWPYYLWSVIQLMVIAAMGGVLNDPVPWKSSHLVTVLWWPASQFWFLQTLFLLHLAGFLLLPRIGPKGLLVVALFCLELPRWFDLQITPERFCIYALWYALGTLLATSPVVTRPAGARTPLVALALIGLWLLAARAVIETAGLAWLPNALPVSLLGAAACLALARTPWVTRQPWLLVIGRHSLAILVLHVFFVAGTRVAWVHLAGVTEPWIVLPTAVMAGLFGPLAVRALAVRAGIGRLVGLA